VAAELQLATNGGVTPPQLTPPEDTDAGGWSRLGDAWYKVDIIDTASRLNINTADGATLAKLPAFQSSPEIAAAIIDWRDTDNDVSALKVGNGTVVMGAESETYQTASPPYNAKNAPFDTAEELLLLKGMTPQILYGGATPTTGNQPDTVVGVIGRSAPTRQAGGQGGSGTSGLPAVDTSASTMPLSEMITTYSRELNVASDGTKRVNIRTANAQALQDAGLSRQTANQIIQGRGNGGANLTSIADLMNIPGITRTIMQQIGDKISISDAQYRNGVVNINTAPAEVLATIPGVDQTIYNAVIQARQNGTMFTGLNDIFQLTQLNRQQLQKLVDYVCTKSSVYLLRVRVRIAGSQKVFAAQALVELTAAPAATATAGSSGTQTPASSNSTQVQTPTVLQWREVARSPGWSTWTTPPNYYSTSALGGTVGNR
jgi:DNA uptake protein ComE-like DNA-binding protein